MEEETLKIEEITKPEGEESKKADIALGNLYQANKALVRNGLKELTVGELNSKKEIVKNYLHSTSNNYYMLLCNELKDYTIFKINNKNDKEKLIETAKILVDECLVNRGEIRAIDLTENKDAIECWIYTNDDAFAYYFFPYDAAIIEV